MQAYFDFLSEGASKVWEFFIVANIEEKTQKRITPHLVRRKFGGTLFPGSPISVEPLEESGIWWSEALYDKQGVDEADTQACLQPIRDLVKWFTDRPEFKDTAFVRIGDRTFNDLPKSDYPDGTQLTPGVFPRLVLGMTKNGSLVGLYCYSVQS